MELLDWTVIDSWKAGKLMVMAGILLYQAFFRWTPFLAIRKFDGSKAENFSASIRATHIPWFFFASLFHAVLLSVFAFVSYKLNPNAWLFYGLLFLGSVELILFLTVGVAGKLFAVRMGKNSIILSRGYLTMIPLNEVQRIEKKYSDEIYLVKKNGKVETINFRIFDKKDLTEFLIKLKNNAESHQIYFANDLAGEK